MEKKVKMLKAFQWKTDGERYALGVERELDAATADSMVKHGYAEHVVSLPRVKKVVQKMAQPVKENKMQVAAKDNKKWAKWGLKNE